MDKAKGTNYKCRNCGYAVRLPKVPKYCPQCGSNEISKSNDRARTTALKLIDECNDIIAKLEPLLNETVVLQNELEQRMQTLRTYKRRGIITANEIPTYEKATQKMLRNSNKINTERL